MNMNILSGCLFLFNIIINFKFGETNFECGCCCIGNEPNYTTTDFRTPYCLCEKNGEQFSKSYPDRNDTLLLMEYNTSVTNTQDHERNGFLSQSSLNIRRNDDSFANQASYFHQLENGSIVYNSPGTKHRSFSIHYYCRETTPEGIVEDGNILITCPCGNRLQNNCCPSSHMLFVPNEVNKTDFWQCEFDNEDLSMSMFVGSREIPEFVLIRKDLRLADDTYKETNNLEYEIIEGSEPHGDSNNANVSADSVIFKVAYQCVEMNKNRINSSRNQQIICGSVLRQSVVSFINYYQAMTILCAIFHTATLIIFILLPEIRTMKSKIIICQTVSFLVLNAINLRFYVSEGHLPRTECLLMAYMLHFWNLVGTFWINVLCVDMAWTFSGTHFYRSDRWKFMRYSLYAWGTPTFITTVTAIIANISELPENILRPRMSLATCWFQDYKPLVAYHYGPILVLTLANGPLLAYTIYKITQALRSSSSILSNSDSSYHTGPKPKKGKKMFVIYANLALMLGMPRILGFIRLLVDNVLIILFINIVTMLRSFFIFMFVSCRPKVYEIVRERVSLWSSKAATFARTGCKEMDKEQCQGNRTSFSYINDTHSSVV